MKKENKKKGLKNTIVIILVIVIFLLVGFIVWRKYIDKTYKIEDIKEFSYFKLYQNEKYGVIDKKATVLVEPKYDLLVIPNPSQAVFIGYFNYNSQTGEYETEVLNEKGEKILTQYEQVLPLMFQDALAEVPYEKSVLMYKENGKYGIINFKGKKITKPIYDSIESLLYKEGCLLVKQDGKYGIINIQGKQMVEVRYDSITADGYYDQNTKYQKAGFIVGEKKQEGYRYGYIKYNGSKLLEVEYNEIDRITEITENEVYLLALKNGQAGIYKNKKQIIEHNYQEIEYNEQNQLFLVQKNDKQGVMNKEGKLILEVEYDYIMISGQSINAQKNGNTYYFNTKGEKIQNNITTIPTENSNYFITINQQDKFGIIDKNNNIILENVYSYIEYAFNNYFIITKDLEVSVINVENREEQLKGSYNVIQKIENRNILQAIILNPYTIELYNKDLKKIASMQQATISVQENFIKLSSSVDRKYFDINGNEIQNTQVFPNLSLFAFKQENKWGFKNNEGKVIVEPIYDMVTELNSYGFAGIKQNGKWGVINFEGKVIVEPMYEIEWEEPEFIGPYAKLDFGYGMVYYSKDLQKELQEE